MADYQFVTIKGILALSDIRYTPEDYYSIATECLYQYRATFNLEPDAVLTLFSKKGRAKPSNLYPVYFAEHIKDIILKHFIASYSKKINLDKSKK
jgi:hypothetical protein